MRKILSMVTAMALVTVILSSGAMAQGSKNQKGATGAGRGQEQSSRQYAPGNNQTEHSAQNDKTSDWKKSNQDTVVTGATGTLDAGTEPDENDAGATPNEKDKPTWDGERHEPKGRWMNIQTVTEAIGLLTDADTTAQLNALLTAYRNATDEASAKTTLTALLEALAKAGVSEVPLDSSGEVQVQPFSSRNIEVLREKVLSRAGNSNGTLLALLHAYENALLQKDHQEDADDTDTSDDTDPEQTGTGIEAGNGGTVAEALVQLNATFDLAN